MRSVLFAILFGIFCVGGALKVAAQEVSAAKDSGEAKEASLLDAPVVVPVLQVRDAIHVGVSETLKRLVSEARRIGAPAIVVELDTPGGFLDATRDIVQLMLATEDLKWIVYVTPEGARAASAGSMMTLAAHYAAMAPTTSIGAATPVAGQGQQLGEDVRKKMTNDTVAFVEGIAEKRGRNKEWAKKSVVDAASLSATDALSNNVIDGIHANRDELWLGARAKYADLPKDVRFVAFDLNLKERFLSLVSNPNVAYGLLALGALGIYVEISNPGMVIPGTIGALSLVLGAITMKIVPIRPGAIALLVVGLILIIIEIFTPLPTYGVAGVGGAVSLFLSGLFLLDPAETNLTLSAGIWLPAFLVIVGFMSWLGLAAGRSIRSQDRVQGMDRLVGATGDIVVVDSPTRGALRLGGELWSAEFVSEALAKEAIMSVGLTVKVVERKGFTLYVIPATQS